MTKTKKFRASVAEFHNFTQFINDYMIKNYGFRYLSAEDLHSKWREKVPYSEQTAKKILAQTVTFVNLMISSRSNSNNPSFMAKLIDDIADFLSKYFAKSPEYKCRKQAIKILVEKISNANYTLRTRQAKTETASATEQLQDTQNKETGKRKRARIMVNATYKQVNNLFNETQRDLSFYRKK